MKCENCGFKNREGVKFCEKCGATLPDVKGLVCTNCRKENRAGIRFCEKCGNPLSEGNKCLCGNCGFENRPEINFCEKCGDALGGTRFLEQDELSHQLHVPKPQGKRRRWLWVVGGELAAVSPYAVWYSRCYPSLRIQMIPSCLILWIIPGEIW